VWAYRVNLLGSSKLFLWARLSVPHTFMACEHAAINSHPSPQRSSPHTHIADPSYLDGQVLRWFGYFKEAVPESPNENHRVRRIVICHYLSDDTTEVQEPKVINSGIWQVGGWESALNPPPPLLLLA